MKRFSTFLVGMALVILAGYSADAQNKVVVLEQFTGAWCGWCPGGTVIMDQLSKELGDKFIGVKVHQGDGMEIPGVIAALKPAVPYYPAGAIDRKYYSDLMDPNYPSIGISREKWREAVLRRLNDKAVAGVSVKNSSFDPLTRKLTVTVAGTFSEAVSGTHNFNLYLIEDSVSGTGSAYDQSNYYSGRFPGDPYNDLPAVIKGYQHRHVVRAMLGGPTGDASQIPSPVEKGKEYEHTYNFTVPDEWKADQMDVIAMIMRTGATANTDWEITNAVKMEMTDLPVSIVVPSFSEMYVKLPAGAPSIRKVTLTNPEATEVTAALALDKTTPLPAGWTATLAQNTVTIPAKGTATVDISVNCKGAAQYAPLTVTARTSGSATTLPRMMKATTNILSDNAKYVVYSTEQSATLATLSKGILNARTDIGNASVLLPFSAECLAAYPPKDFEVGIFHTELAPIDAEGDAFSPLAVINQMINNNKRVLITGQSGMGYVYNPQAPATGKTQAAKDFFEKRLGIAYGKTELRVNLVNGQMSSQKAFMMDGFENDPIGNGYSAMCNIAQGYYTYSTETMTINNGSRSAPVLYYDGDVEAIGAVRYQEGDKKIVYFGFSPIAPSAVAAREELINKAVDWLLASTTDAGDVVTAPAGSAVLPNPVTGAATLHFTSETGGNAVITAVNALGMNVASFPAELQVGANSVALPVSELPAGAYSLVVKSGGKAVRLPFAVAR